ncbi:MAG: acyl-[Butyrivibrio sp.]|nr:acyl-[acyl-carrier-protein] thioesterase [Butyrivibrio sp.]
MYTFDAKIRYSEVDSNAKLTIESLINYFQDSTIFQTQSGPASIDYLKRNGLAWVLSAWQITVNRYPKLCEDVTIGTMPYELKGAVGLRNFFMDGADGERLAVANSIWTLVDVEKEMPIRITEEIASAYVLDEKLDMDYSGRKIVLPKDGERIECQSIEITRGHIDTNKHVNNGRYIRMAIDCLGNEDFKISKLRAEYKRQARLGDVLCPVVIKSKKEDNDVYTVCFDNSEGELVCVVELI